MVHNIDLTPPSSNYRWECWDNEWILFGRIVSSGSPVTPRGRVSWVPIYMINEDMELVMMRHMGTFHGTVKPIQYEATAWYEQKCTWHQENRFLLEDNCLDYLKLTYG